MKKILALVLAIIMMAAIAVPAFAEDPVREDRTQVENFVGDADNTETVSPDVKVTYGVAQTYTLSIPADVALEDYTNQGGNDTNLNNLRATASIGATNVKINGKETLTVTATSKNSWKLVDENGKSTAVDYALKMSATESNYAALVDNTVLTVATPTGNNGIVGNTGTSHLEFTSKGTAQEGIFSDIITFNVVITESNS